MADQGSEGLLSPWLRKQRFKAAEPFLNGRILDFGCGSGALAELVEPDRYLGVEIDVASLQLAQNRFPNYRFAPVLPDTTEKFDVIISLAVIEHAPDPARFLSMLTAHLSPSDEACIVITTPHPKIDWIHGIGATIGLFSKHANEEHEALLDKIKLESAGHQAGLRLNFYQRFLFGANQLTVFKKDTT